MVPELDSVEARYRELTRSLADPAVLSNPAKFREISKERAELEILVRKQEELRRVQSELRDAGDILADAASDSEIRALAEVERKDLEARAAALQQEIKVLRLPKDPLDEKNVFLEIRAGAGGDESSLFSQDLARMYTRYAESRGWKAEIVEASLSPVGGYKEVILGLQGQGAYSRLKYESGVHRVQRIPRTEASGRIHTSTVTVAVLAEADEVDVKLDPKDLKIEAFGSSGPGGQNVNRNYTAIRVTHKPSGQVVSCQDEKSQHRNKEKALRVLRSRLLEIARSEQQEKIAQSRRAQVGTGERSEKIRTYNFPQSRVTDHRLGESFHQLAAILDGEIESILERVILEAQARELESTGGGAAV